MTAKLRWGTYFKTEGQELESFLAANLDDERRVIRYILGLGFDPRMLEGLRAIRKQCPRATLQVDVVQFEEGEKSPSHEYQELSNKNTKSFDELTAGLLVTTRAIAMYSAQNRRITAKSAEGVYKKSSDFTDCTDAIVDVSSMPRSVFLPIIAKLLHIFDRPENARKNLIVFASENSELDSVIVEEGIDDEADYVHPFRGDAERESKASKPRVWFPLLGENQSIQLKRVAELVKAEEICPLLPAPSVDPRRGDNLVLEHREFLFDEHRVDPGNFLYASEANPFEVYRQLMRAIRHYAKTLSPLGGANPILSVLSSKLISIGAILAAYELKAEGSKVAIAHIESHGYKIAVHEEKLFEIANRSVLHGLWLTGESYEA